MLLFLNGDLVGCLYLHSHFQERFTVMFGQKAAVDLHCLSLFVSGKFIEQRTSKSTLCQNIIRKNTKLGRAVCLPRNNDTLQIFSAISDLWFSSFYWRKKSSLLVGFFLRSVFLIFLLWWLRIMTLVIIIDKMIKCTDLYYYYDFVIIMFSEYLTMLVISHEFKISEHVL